MKVLLTGGAGYIGSHTAVAMIEAGHEVVIADNLANSSSVVISRIQQITGVRPTFYLANVANEEIMNMIFEDQSIDAVVHFAGLKAVGESVRRPLAYYRNNFDATLTLLETMAEHSVHKIIFSSSATVYGEDSPYPYEETMPRGTCSSPYGWTKSMIEQIIMDYAKADASLSAVILRYFNPIGAHESGLIGEDPLGIPNNLMPFISQVAVGKREKLTVFGGDYDTPDGTCRRDYLHVMDLAEGHVKAVEFAMEHSGTEIVNLGTGTPYSVLEIIEAFQRNNGVAVPYVIGDRRKGDLPEFWADATKAKRVLDWTARRDLDAMCRDSWNWQGRNPEGYRTRGSLAK